MKFHIVLLGNTWLNRADISWVVDSDARFWNRLHCRKDLLMFNEISHKSRLSLPDIVTRSSDTATLILVHSYSY
jgi:hypothetical protein